MVVENLVDDKGVFSSLEMKFGGSGVQGGFGEEVIEVRSAERLFNNGGTEVQRPTEVVRFKRPGRI